jgi:aminocarboxymuconate-semialdehyde decarboxylase
VSDPTIPRGKYADPEEVPRRCYFDSPVFQPEALCFLCAKVGADRVMLGSDYPFPIGDPAPVRVVEESGFGPEDRKLILGGTAAAIFGLERHRNSAA